MTKEKINTVSMEDIASSASDTEEIFIPMNSKGLGLFKIGDRVKWCDGCYGDVVFVWGDLVCIITDDGVSRLGNEKYIKHYRTH